MTRTEIATIAHWTLQRREFDTGFHDYVVQADDRRLPISLYVEDHANFETESVEYTVTATPVSRQLDLDELAEFAALVQEATIAARTFQHLIETTEGRNS